jgi:hypothetical protein
MKRAILLSIILIPFLAAAQVTGRVVSGNNSIPFATIIVKNTNIGTYS